MTGWSFAVQPVDIDESPRPGEMPSDYVLRLAGSKARAAGSFASTGQIVLAADTTVADGAQVLGKPADAQEAREMLRSLCGRKHCVYTAIGISSPRDESTYVDLCETQVWMRHYTDNEIDAYIASGDPFDKAGAYAIQNPDFHPVERIVGCYTGVVGLPLCRVVRGLAQFDLYPPVDLTGECPEHLEAGTPCLVYQQITSGD